MEAKCNDTIKLFKWLKRINWGIRNRKILFSVPGNTVTAIYKVNLPRRKRWVLILANYSRDNAHIIPFSKIQTLPHWQNNVAISLYCVQLRMLAH